MPPAAATSTGFMAGRLRQLPAERPHLRRCTKLLCSAFITVLFFVGVILFVLYLAVRPHRPRFHVTAFSAAGIPSGGPVVLSGQVSVHNPNHDVAFLFDRFYMAVQYRGASAAAPSEQPVTAAPQYLQPGETMPLAFQGVEASATVAQEMARDAAAGGAVAMTVQVRSRVRARLAFWGNRHWHPLHASCEVAVGPDGQLLPEYLQKRCSIDFFP